MDLSISFRKRGAAMQYPWDTSSQLMSKSPNASQGRGYLGRHLCPLRHSRAPLRGNPSSFRCRPAAYPFPAQRLSSPSACPLPPCILPAVAPGCLSPPDRKVYRLVARATPLRRGNLPPGECVPPTHVLPARIQIRALGHHVGSSFRPVI